MRLHAGMLDHDVEVSHDAGRFVCNYTLYRSLAQCQQHCQRLQRLQRADGRWHALFVHVPPFDVIPKAEQLEFASDLLRLVRRAVPSAAADAGGAVNGLAAAPEQTTAHWPLPEAPAAAGEGGGALQHLLRWLQVDRLRSASLALLGYLVWTRPSGRINHSP